MASTLELLPVELVDHIVRHLDRKAVKALRRTSQCMYSKVRVDSWRKRYQKKTVYLTKHSLESLIAVTQPERLGCMLEHLIIAAPMSDIEYPTRFTNRGTEKFRIDRNSKSLRAVGALTDMHLELSLFREEEKIKLLSEAFNNIKNNGDTGTLRTVLLKATTISYGENQRINLARERHYEEGWEGAAEAFRVTTTSLARSELRITEHLGLTSCKTSLTICELPMLETISCGLAKSLSSLKSLSISVPDAWKALDHFPRGKAYFTWRSQQKEIEEFENSRNYPSLTTLLRCVPALEELEIHHRGYSDDHRQMVAQMVQCIVAAGPFPKLLRCALQRLTPYRKMELAALKDAAPNCTFFNELGKEILRIEEPKTKMWCQNVEVGNKHLALVYAPPRSLLSGLGRYSTAIREYNRDSERYHYLDHPVSSN